MYFLIALIGFLILGWGTKTSGQVVINEVLIKPTGLNKTNSLLTTCRNSEFEQAKEWIELYNTNLCDSLDLSCHILVTNSGSADVCVLFERADQQFGLVFPPNTKIAPGGYLIIGGKEADVPRIDLEPSKLLNRGFCAPTRVEIRNDGGWLALFRPDTTVMDAIFWTNTEQERREIERNTFDYWRNDYRSDNCACTPAQRILPSARKLFARNQIAYAGATLDVANRDQYIALARQYDGSDRWVRLQNLASPGNANGTVIEKPIVRITPRSDSTCTGGLLKFSAETSKGAPTAQTTYEWLSIPPGFSATTPTIQPRSRINRQYVVRAFNSGCIVTDTVWGRIGALPFTAKFTADKTTLCPKELVLITYVGGTISPDMRFKWDFGDAKVLSGQNAGPFSVIWSTQGEKQVKLVVEQEVCSTDTFSLRFKLAVPNPPTFTVSPTQTCVGQPINVSISGDPTNITSYNWDFAGATATPGDNLSSSHTLRFDTPGQKNIRLSVLLNGQICETEQTQQTITILPIPQPQLKVSSPICPNTATVITYTGSDPGGFSFNWDFDGGIVTPGGNSGPGPHTVRWPEQHGIRKTVRLTLSYQQICNSETFSAPVDLKLKPDAKFTLSDSIITAGEDIISFRLNIPPNPKYIYRWQILPNAAPYVGSMPPDMRFNTPGRYPITLTVIDEDDCQASYTTILLVNPPNNLIQIPNALRPTGFNNLLIIPNLASLQTFDFQIFDRWGKRVFYTSKPNEFWNGRDSDGTLVPEGVYTYYLSGLFYNGDALNRIGTITVIH